MNKVLWQAFVSNEEHQERMAEKIQSLEKQVEELKHYRAMYQSIAGKANLCHLVSRLEKAEEKLDAIANRGGLVTTQMLKQIARSYFYDDNTEVKHD